MKKIILYIAFISMQTYGFSQQITRNEAQIAATNALQHYELLDSMKNYNFFVEKINSVKDNSQNILMYEVVFDNKHSVLVSGNKNCKPILGYLQNIGISIFNDTDNKISCCLKQYIEKFKQQNAYCFEKSIYDANNVLEWNNLLAGIQQSSQSSDITIGPLLTTRWGQSVSNCVQDCKAYNYFVTAEDNDCGYESFPSKTCPIGCAAVAMANVLNYWKYAKNQYFDWCNMADRLWTINNPNYEAERDAVAGLMYKCAENAHSLYCVFGTCATSVLMYSVRNTMRDFGYNASRDANPRENELIANLKNYRPVIFNGATMGFIFTEMEEIHTFVVDGYRSSDNMFHFNWGWYDSGNVNDNWLVLSALNDNSGAEGTHNWNNWTAIVDIYPDDIEAYNCKIAQTLSLFDYYSQAYMVVMAALYAGIPLPQNILFDIKNSVPKTANIIVDIPKTNDAILEYFRQIGNIENIQYIANNSIILKSTFHATRGSKFTAKIKPCPNCDNTNNALPNGNIIADSAPQEDSFIEMQNVDNQSNIYIYPNPNKGIFTISASTDMENIKVLDLTGHIVYQDNPTQSRQVQIDLSNVAQGIYIVYVECKNKTFTEKLVIQ